MAIYCNLDVFKHVSIYVLPLFIENWKELILRLENTDKGNILFDDSKYVATWNKKRLKFCEINEKRRPMYVKLAVKLWKQNRGMKTTKAELPCPALFCLD